MSTYDTCLSLTLSNLFSIYLAVWLLQPKESKKQAAAGSKQQKTRPAKQQHQQSQQHQPPQSSEDAADGENKIVRSAPFISLLHEMLSLVCCGCYCSRCERI